MIGCYNLRLLFSEAGKSLLTNKFWTQKLQQIANVLLKQNLSPVEVILLIMQRLYEISYHRDYYHYHVSEKRFII